MAESTGRDCRQVSVRSTTILPAYLYPMVLSIVLLTLALITGTRTGRIAGVWRDAR